MGAQCSKKGDDNSSTPQLPSQINTPDLSSYEADCRLDPTLQTFDVNLRERTSLVINTLAVGMEVRSVSLDSLRSVTTCLLDMNQEVVKVILDSKKDIWNTPELFHLVEDYFDNSLQTLDFCTALEKCLKQARDTQFMVQISMQQFEKDAEESSFSELKNSKTLEELKNLRSAGSPFNEEFFSLFQSVSAQQVSMLHRLHIRKRKLDKKLRALKVWRRVSNVIFVTALVAVLICSVAAAAINAPPVVTAVAAASAVPFGSMGKWFDSMWKGFEDAVKGQGEIVRSMQVATMITIKDLDGIGVLVSRLEKEIESLLENGDSMVMGGEDEEAMKVGVVEIKNKIALFMKTVDDLVKHADKCSQDIMKARTVVLQRIIRNPSED